MQTSKEKALLILDFLNFDITMSEVQADADVIASIIEREIENVIVDQKTFTITANSTCKHGNDLAVRLQSACGCYLTASGRIFQATPPTV